MIAEHMTDRLSGFHGGANISVVPAYPKEIMSIKHYTLVFGLSRNLDAMALVAPLMKNGKVQSITGMENDLIEKRAVFVEKFQEVWNGLPHEIRTRKDVGAILNLVIEDL